MAGIGDIFGGLFSGSQDQTKKTVEDTSQHQASTGQTAQTGAGAQDYNLGQWSSWALNQLPTAYNWAQGATQGAAAPTSWGQISPLLTPFANSQIQATFAAQQPQIQDMASKIKGDASGNPYASSTNGALSRFYGQVAGQQGQIAAGIQNQSYTQALQAAQEDARRALQAGQSSGNLTKSTLDVGQYIPYGGTKTANAATGTSSGIVDSTGHNVSNSTATTTNNPSAASQIGTVAGIAANALPYLLPFSDERVKDNIKEVGKTHDGQPIYVYNKLGSPFKEMGLLAQDVEKKHPDAVGSVGGIKTVDYDAATKGAERKADGGGVGNTFADSVRKHFHAFHSMRKHAENGGKINGYDDGGFVSPDSGSFGSQMPSDASWTPVVDRAPQDTGMTLAQRAQGILGAIGGMGMQRQGTPAPAQASAPAQPERDRRPADAASTRNPALEALAALQGPPRAYAGGRQGYADGGAEDSWLGGLARSLTPNSPFAPPDSPTAMRLRNDYGVDPRAMYSPSRNLVSDLASIDTMVPGHSGPLSGISKRMADENAAAFKGAEVLHNDAQLRGQFASGAKTLAGEAAPGLRALTAAQTEHAKAGSEPAQIRIKAIEQANALHQQRLKSIDDMEFVDPNPAANAMYYQQQRAAAEVAHEAALKRLQGTGASQPAPAPSGVRTWNPNLPNGGL